jgi:4-hydroxy-3-methylbut-2-enyl diphosphate reductase
MQIILANPRGFCAGVERAIAIVERAIEIRRTDLRPP